MHHAGWLQLDIISKYINLMAKPIIAAVNSIVSWLLENTIPSLKATSRHKTSSNNLAEMTRKGHNDRRYICCAIFLVADDDSKMELNTQHVNLFPSFFWETIENEGSPIKEL